MAPKRYNDVAVDAVDQHRNRAEASTSLHLSCLPPTTLWYRLNGRPTRRENAIKQQYLTPREEKVLVKFLLRMSKSNYPVPVKFLRPLARVIRRQRSYTFPNPVAEDDTPLPGKNWPQGFYKRHPELKARRAKPIAWSRHEVNIHHKVSEWFTVIGKELHQPVILQENVYNMDETGVLLSVLNSVKVLLGSDDLRGYRGAGVQRTLITAIECIAADGRYLNPLIIWPAAAHRSTWTVHPTPGWHFACSKSGYTDSAISFYWIQHVFDPQTRDRANGMPRVLISDGFGTHESLEVLTYCFENNIILCRLPSHTSHKLQPCDVGVFGPLKTAYREQVDLLYRGGANTVGKQHFTFLYDRARQTAFTHRNIRSGWLKAGLFPFNPEKVLGEMPKPAAESASPRSEANIEPELRSYDLPIRTPTTSTSFNVLRCKVEATLDTLNDEARLNIQKLANAGENVFAERALLHDRERILLEQNNEKTVRKSMRSTVVGKAKVMSYEDIVEARRKRDEKDANKAFTKSRRKPGAGKTTN